MAVVKKTFFLCVLIGTILVAVAVEPVINVDGESDFGVIYNNGGVLPTYELVRTVEGHPTPSEQVTYGSPNAPDLVPQFQFQGRMYSYRNDTQDLKSLSGEWSCVGTLNEFVFHSSDFSADFQTNRNDYVNCSIYANPDDKGRLYLEFEARYYLFIQERLTYSWIYCNGILYLHEDSYCRVFNIPPADSESVLPEDSVCLGQCAFSPKYHLPSKELSSNNVYLFSKNIYYNAGAGIIYIEIPSGIAGGQTRYDRYYPVPNDFCADLR